MDHILKHSKSVRYSQVLNDPLPASARRIVMKIPYAFSFSFIFTFSSTASTMKRKNSEEVDIIIIMAMTRFFRKDLFQGNDNRKGQRFLKRMKTPAHLSRIHQRATPHFVVQILLTHKILLLILPPRKRKFLSTPQTQNIKEIKNTFRRKYHGENEDSIYRGKAW